MNTKKIAVTWLSLVMLISLIVIIVEIAPRVEAPTMWYVDDSNPGPGDGSSGNPFKTIQAGVDNATSGDIVYVHNGTYYENVIVNKSVHLEGENKSRTIIDGQKNEATLFIRDIINVSVNHFSIHNGSGSQGSLRVDNASVEISNCYVNGSRGYDSDYFAEDGSPGISSIDSTVTVINSSINGGRGGDYIVNEFFVKQGMVEKG